MRLLHTADWHVGRTIRGRSRAGEHRAVLAEIVAVAAEHEVDLVLVAGDVFDTASPSPESEAIVYRALLDLVATGAQVVVVAGNHDNPRRLAAVRPLLALGRVHVATDLARPDAGGVVELSGRGGEVARLALVPFLSQRAIVRADDLMDPERGATEHSQSYADRAARILGALTARARADTIDVVVAHLLVAGGTLGGGERSAHTIFDYAVPGAAFPTALHYGALGHLHRTQQVPAGAPLWYAGSPLQLDFGETANQPAVLVVDVAPDTPAAVTRVPLSAGRRLTTLTGPLDALRELVGTTGDDHLKVVVDEPPRPGLADDLRELFPTAVDVVVRTARPAGQALPPPGEGRLARSPHELFARYLDAADATDPRLIALFDELLDEDHATDPA